MVSEKWIKDMIGYIADVNTKEIADHIANNNLKEWIDSWSNSFSKLVKSVVKCYEEDNGWISVKDIKPQEENPVQILVYDDHFDYPDIYVDTGWRINDAWISHDELVEGHVIAWKPLETPLAVKEIRELGWI